MNTADLCREHGISSVTFYDWKQKFGGMDVSKAQQLKALLMKELNLHGEAVKGAIRNNGWSLHV